MSAVHHHHHWHDFDRYHLRNMILRLAVGVLVVVGLHAAAVYVALNWNKEPTGEQSPPAAIMIELAPMAVSQQSQEEVAPGPQMVQAPEPVPDAPDEPEDAEPPPPEPEVQQTVEKMPETPPAPAEAEVVLPKPEPKKVEEAKPKPKEPEKPKKEAKPTRRRSAPVTSAAPRSDAPTAQTTAAPSPGAAAARSAALADWKSRAFAHLNRFKRPQGSNVGRPGISITIAGSGAVTGVSLAGSSGNSVLDQEAMAMARRASPFPAPPDGKGMTFGVAINFRN
ncbi:TonB family protein [Xanthobacter autotrophicus DSM 597]|uniref:energy transducer TonB family protein n=1 Tax=Xanthobacter TaxID=279 RepID=UPI001AEAC172|nr:protein TonB [Xanthobacter flavus]